MRLPFSLRLPWASRPAQMTTTANSADIPENDGYWRSIRDGKRDLPEAVRDRALSTAVRLVEYDGIASRMTQQIREWCVGDGVSLSSCLKDQAKREAHEEALALLWDEPQSGWDTLPGEIAETLAPIGELLVTENPAPSGKVTAYGVVDPENIDRVLVNRNNARQTVGVLLKRAPGATVAPFFFDVEFREWAKANPVGAAAAGYSTLPPLGGEFSIPGTTAYGGATTVKVGPDCSYFGWRRRLGATRGLSMFFPVADLIGALDRAIFQQIEGVGARNAWAVVAKLPSGTPGDAKKFAEELASQMGKGGGHAGIAGNAEFQVLTPDLGAVQFDVHLTSMLKIVSAETGWPVTWLGLGTDAGNSATTELAGPAMKMMSLHQGAIRKAIHRLISHGLKRMTVPAGFTPEEWLDFEVVMPQIGGRDMVRDSAALAQGMVAVDSGIEQGAFTTAKAGEITRDLFGKFLGVEFTADDVPDPEEAMPVTGPGDTTGTPPEDDEDPTDDEAREDADDLARAREQGRKARSQQGRRKVTV